MNNDALMFLLFGLPSTDILFMHHKVNKRKERENVPSYNF